MNPWLGVVAFASGRALAEPVAAALGATLLPLEERRFEDGERKVRPLTSVRGADLYVVEALHASNGLSPDDKLVRLLLLCDTLRDHGARRVTVVASYLCYARKDRRTQPRDPLSLRTVARLVEAVRVDRVAVLEVHQVQAFENAFRIPTLHVDAWAPLAEEAARRLAGRPPVVLSPDLGGVARAARFAGVLAGRLGVPVPTGFVEKHRSGGRISGEALVGDVAGRAVVIVDDLVSSGATLVRAAEASLRHGARGCLAVAAHGLFSRGAAALLDASPLESVLVTDSVEPSERPSRAAWVGCAPELARAVGLLAGDLPSGNLHAAG